MVKTWWRAALTALALLAFLPSPGFTQTQATTGVISGTVVDESDAVLPGASVAIRNTATNFQKTETTDTGGRFRAILLPLGPYTITVSLPGFTTLVREGVNLSVGQEVILRLLERLAAADGQRPKAVRIAHGNQAVFRQHHERERAAHLRHGVHDGLLDRLLARTRVQMDDDLAVGGRLEDGALPHEGIADLVGIHKVAVVAERERPVHAVDDDRLRIRELAVSGGGVAHVTDGLGPWQLRQGVLVERLVDMPHCLRVADPHTVGRRNAGALLAPVLQGVESEIRQVGSLGMSVDPEHAAFVFEFVEHHAIAFFLTRDRSIAVDQTSSHAASGSSITTRPSMAIRM